MTRRNYLLAISVLLICSSTFGQRALAPERDGPSSARLLSSVESLQADLRDARRLIGDVNDRRLRRELERVLSRAIHTAGDLESRLEGSPQRRRGRQMGEAEFARLLDSIKDRSFDDDKLKFIETYIKNLRISSDQASRILKSLSFDDGRVKAAIAIYPSVVDPERYYEVLKIFPFEESRQQVMEAVKK